MTDADARALKSGDRIRLIVRNGMPPPARNIFTVARVEVRHGEPEIISTDGFAFVPWEVERYEGMVNH
jgi:hypothetical protein